LSADCDFFAHQTRQCSSSIHFDCSNLSITLGPPCGHWVLTVCQAQIFSFTLLKILGYSFAGLIAKQLIQECNFCDTNIKKTSMVKVYKDSMLQPGHKVLSMTVCLSVLVEEPLFLIEILA